MSKLSVVIPFVNEYPQNIFTIQNIAQELMGRCDFEILAVDNFLPHVATEQGYPEDKGGEAIKAASELKGNPWLTYIKYSDKLSHWQSKNYAIKKSSGDILFFCDAHCIVSRNALFRMFQYYVEHEEELNGTLHLPLSYKILECHYLIYKLVYAPEKWDLSYSFTGFRPSEVPYEVPAMSCCGVMMSRRVYDALGGWPTGLGIYSGGEQFLNYTLAVLGMKKHIFPVPALYHHGDKRGYHWNYDDSLRNRFIANYMFGGEKWLNGMVETAKGRPEVKKLFGQNVIKEHKAHREFIKRQQKVSIEDWIKKWNVS